MPNEPRTGRTQLKRARARLDWATNELSIAQRVLKDRKREVQQLELNALGEAELRARLKAHSYRIDENT